MRTCIGLAVSLSLLIAAGCGSDRDGGMKMQAMEKATVSMADNEDIQTAFSEGRVRVMEKDQSARREMLRNTLLEQEMMRQSPDEFRQSMEMEQTARNQAFEDPALQRQLLEQMVRESNLVMQHTDLKRKMLKQNIDSFHAIAASPEFRSPMADAMLLLMNDPKIKRQMEQMIKMALAREMKKMEAQLKRMLDLPKSRPQQTGTESRRGSEPETGTPQTRQPEQPNQPPAD